MKGYPIKYSYQELEFIESNCQLVISELFAAFSAEFNREDVSAMNINSVRKRNGWLSGRTGRFEKGHIPHSNAGTKTANRTSFKKGRQPHSWQPIGHERTCRDGYLQRKITDTRCTQKDYAYVHRLVYEQNFGKIPLGHVVIFRDNDKTNIEPGNLLAVSRGELAVMNKTGLIYVAPEIKETALLVAKVQIKSNQLARDI